MKSFSWKEWGITPRVILIAVLPVTLMFVLIVLYSYYTRSAEAQEEVNERSRLVASLLAQDSEYPIISGNLSYLQATATWLLQVDQNIQRVQILNRDKRSLLDIARKSHSDVEAREFEAPVRRTLIGVNGFDDDGPHVSSALGVAQPVKSMETIGYVRVIAATSPAMLAKHRQRMLIGSTIAGVGLLATALLGLSLAMSLTTPLVATIAAVRDLRRGDYSVGMDVTAGGEIGELQTSINDMAKSLYQLTSELENKVLARTRELEAANAEKRRLIHQVNSVVEDERKAIANEIHDHLNANLIAVRLTAQRILNLAEQGRVPPSANEIREGAGSIIRITSDLYKQARGIVRKLRPEAIEVLGLCGAVKDMIRNYDTLHPGCRFSFEEQGDFSGLTDELSIAVYRLVQEALSNVVKHSGATTACVSLQCYEERQRLLRIKVDDNGVGFDMKTVETGIGLIGMRERVHGLGGTMAIRTAPGAGTTITIDLPVQQ